MKQVIYIVLFWLNCLPVSVHGQGQAGMFVHDPSMIREDSSWYLFCTGRGISVWSSPDWKEWRKEHSVFDSLPWAVKAIKGFRDHVWAPDISFHQGRYYLYYAVSTFGKNSSCIGVATNRTLDPGAPGFGWVDHGPVLCSVPGRDMWNAIDPNLILDERGGAWLAFGSFWEGIKLARLSDSLTSLAVPEEWHTIARRPRSFALADSAAGDGAIEAPFIYRRGKYFYLFVSFDYCCRGVKSNYKMVVGRSAAVTGPYLDREGRRMDEGGGTVVLAGDERWHGVGHNAVVHRNDMDYLVFHGYDANDQGRPALRIAPLRWEEEWPIVAP